MNENKVKVITRRTQKSGEIHEEELIEWEVIVEKIFEKASHNKNVTSELLNLRDEIKRRRFSINN